MKYGDKCRVIDIKGDSLKKIDDTISNMDLQIEKSLVNGRVDPNLRISKQAWIKDASFCKFFFDIGQKVNELCRWNFDIKGILE